MNNFLEQVLRPVLPFNNNYLIIIVEYFVKDGVEF